MHVGLSPLTVLGPLWMDKLDVHTKRLLSNLLNNVLSVDNAAEIFGTTIFRPNLMQTPCMVSVQQMSPFQHRGQQETSNGMNTYTCSSLGRKKDATSKWSTIMLAVNAAFGKNQEKPTWRLEKEQMARVQRTCTDWALVA